MKRGSVLIVEDNPTENMLIKSAFEDIGVSERVYSVDDGDEAIAFLRRKGKYADCEKYVFPTFLLTDLNMPRVNGFELLLFLKRSHFKIIPTIVFTMSADPDDVKCAYLFGANAYHVKPPGMEGLHAQLRKIYDYWTTLELPGTDEHGCLLETDSTGKLSERMGHPVFIPEYE
ncbi:MAG TPA: response regulator [Verrucomicrobiae bacterium]|nr:response regulator [Verrucomicrobiae bacterium]